MYFHSLNRYKNSILEQYKSNKSHIGSVTARYFLYFFGFLDSLLLPKLIDLSVYAEYEYYKNIIFIYPNILLGSYTGYLYVKFTKGYDLYDALLKVGGAVTIFFSLLVCIVFNNFYFLIPLLAINFFVIIEQQLKVQKEYTLAFLFKPLISVFILTIGLFLFYIGNESLITGYQLLSIVFLLSFVSFLGLSIRFVSFDVSLKITKFSLKKFYYLVNEYATGSLASLALLSMFFSERFLIDKFYADQLPEYSFAFNLVQIFVVAISVFGYISSVEIGSKIETLERNKVVRWFKISVVVFFVTSLFFLFFTYLVSFFYQEFENILWLVAIMTYSKGFYFFIGIFLPIAIYKGFNNKILMIMLALFAVQLFGAVFLSYNSFSIFYLLMSNGIVLIVLSLLLIDVIFKQVNYLK